MKNYGFRLVQFCLLALMVGLVCGCGNKQAAGPNAEQPGAGPEGPGAAMASPLPPAPPTPTLSENNKIPLSAAVPTGVKEVYIKNWDGKVTKFLRFQAKDLVSNQVFDVELPMQFKTPNRTKTGWTDLFMLWGMNREERVAANAKYKLPDSGGVSEYLRELLGAGASSIPVPNSEAGAGTTGGMGGPGMRGLPGMPGMGRGGPGMPGMPGGPALPGGPGGMPGMPGGPAITGGPGSNLGLGNMPGGPGVGGGGMRNGIPLPPGTPSGPGMGAPGRPPAGSL